METYETWAAVETYELNSFVVVISFQIKTAKDYINGGGTFDLGPQSNPVHTEGSDLQFGP